MPKIVLRETDGKPIEIVLDPVNPQDALRFAVQADDFHGEVAAVFGEQGRGHLRLRGQVHRFVAHRESNTIVLWMDGRTRRLHIVDRTARRSQAGQAAAERAELTAPMPGTILKIRVEPGSTFAAHQPVVVMESMKMEMALSLPHAGRIKEILCREGQLVEMGAVLVRLEPRSDGNTPA